MSELGDHSTKETAETLGIEVGTVKARTFRARRLLRDKIAKRLGAKAGKVAASLFSSSRAGRKTVYQTVFSPSVG